MPLEIVRFRGSDILSEDAEVVLAAIMLWTAAWHETPAASLSDDDKVLARAAGYGRSVAGWLAVKEGALRGFVKCSDGRLYHPVVARLANDAWKGKVEQRHRTELSRRKKHNERHPDNQLPLPSFEAFSAHYPDNCPDDIGAVSPRQQELVLATEDDCPDDVPRDIASKGQGKGQGKGESYNKNDDSRAKPDAAPPIDDDPPPDKPDLMGITQRIANAGGVSIVQPLKIAAAMDLVKDWLKNGIDVDETIIPTITTRLANMMEGDHVSSLAYFDGPIRKAHALKGTSRRKTVEKLPPIAAKDDPDDRIAKIRETLKSRCGSRTYDGWLAPGQTAMQINGVGLVVKARSGFMENWVREHFDDTIRVIAQEQGIEETRIVGIK